MPASPLRSFRHLGPALAWLLLAAAAGLWPGPAMAGSLIVDASEYPWSAIGRINTGGRGFCTGFLVGERTALTAAHCLYDYREGRWWHVNDIHFVAGYQRDAYVAHSTAQSFRVARRSEPPREPRVDAILNDWAVIRLKEPIGRKAGWLGMRQLDAKMMAQLRHGSMRAMQAGYRRDRGHVITLGTDCRRPKFFGRGRGIRHRCDVIEGGSGSPLLVFAEGALQAIGIHAVRLERKSGESWAGAVAFTPPAADAKPPQLLELAGSGPAAAIGGRRPEASGPASPVPAQTISTLLARLGFLSSGAQVAAAPGERRSAIKAFERRSGLPETGRESVALLGRLIHALP